MSLLIGFTRGLKTCSFNAVGTWAGQEARPTSDVSVGSWLANGSGALLIDSFTGSLLTALPNPPYTQQNIGSTGVTIGRDGSGNAKGSAVDSVDNAVFDNSHTYANDQYSEITIGGGLGANNYVEALVRVSGTTTTAKHYSAFTNSAADTGFQIYWNGSPTLLTSIAGTFTTGDKLKIKVVGTVLTMYKNGVSIGTYNTASDTNKIASGSAGFAVFNGSGSASVLISDWEAGNNISPLFSQIDETQSDDTDYIHSNTTSTTAEVGLGALSTPQSGTVSVFVRARSV